LGHLLEARDGCTNEAWGFLGVIHSSDIIQRDGSRGGEVVRMDGQLRCWIVQQRRWNLLILQPLQPDRFLLSASRFERKLEAPGPPGVLSRAGGQILAEVLIEDRSAHGQRIEMWCIDPRVSIAAQKTGVPPIKRDNNGL
jgi:hypothetical protein